MRRLAFALGAAALMGCAKTEAPPAEPPAPPPAPPASINLADVAGTWEVRTMAETGDSTLVSYTMMATAADTGWMIMLPNRKPMALTVTVSGDSVMTHVGPYESVLRKKVQVTTDGVLHLRDGKLMGTTVAHYATSAADSVVRLRTEGTRKP